MHRTYLHYMISMVSTSTCTRKGKVCLDGVRFLRTASTTPVEVSKAVQPKERGKEAVSSLLQRVSGGQATRSAAALQHGEAEHGRNRMIKPYKTMLKIEHETNLYLIVDLSIKYGM